MQHDAHTHRPSASRSHSSARSTAGIVVVSLSFGYVLAGVFWSLGWPGFPFGVENDPLAAETAPGGLSSREAPWIAAVAFTGLIVAVLMQRHRAMDALGRTLLAIAWLHAIAFTLVIPDGRPLIAATHVPILILGLPFGWPRGVTIASQLSWPVINQVILMALGVAWAILAIRYARQARGACPRCGRGDTTPSWMHPESAARWGRWAVIVSIIPPALYALTRYAWALGIPLGVSPEFLTLSDDEPTIFVAGAFMATFAVAGAVLSLGLTQRWGEIFPRWVPVLHGRPIPVATAVVPATAATLFLTNGGINWLRAMALDAFPDGAMGADWATTAPGAFFGVWGVALGVATYGYALRRRGRCPRCLRD